MGFLKNFVDGFRPAENPTSGIPETAGSGINKKVLDSTKAESGSYDDVAEEKIGTTSESTVDSDGDGATNDGLKRRLQSRHMQMIAFGGSIGTGLFVGSGSSLGAGGPGFLLIDFMLIGIMLFFVVMALGELATVLPVSGSFAAYSTRFIDPAWGFAMGWNYWLQWFVVLPFELTVSTIVIQYWDPEQKITPGVWITIFLILILVINLFGVRGYGEFESAASIIKIVAVIGFIFCAVVINCGGAPAGQYLGAHTWHDPGAFANGFKGFCYVFANAAFAFGGTELIGLAAAETANPRKEVPKAAKQVFWRIMIFYIVSLFLIGLIVPYNDERLLGASNASASPFVIAMNIGGIKVLPDIFNAVILISVLSVGNSAVYGASRTLAAMARWGQAPAVFGYIDREGRPIPAVLLSLLFGAFAYIQYAASSTDIFNWLLSLSALSSIFTWGSCCLAHIRFRMAWKKQGYSLEEIPWTSPTGVWGSIIGFGFNVLVLIFQFYVSAFPIGEGTKSPKARVIAFFQNYIAVPIVISFYLFAKIVWKTKFVRLSDIDVVTGRKHVSVEELRAEREEERNQPLLKKVYTTIC
ncbi:hypothetical protein OC846_005349 [Tilletia horrida]|uniref:Amino acid permease/ SLC12A domain-containing protein n=1 Tax=Tilletia horrida TaxID=155126 RepID=A0AAN6JRU0_9BASI|nr:hypothetical protein OC846_005349 [Tilletia horrida]KAK0552753.1 hypothetical protein OC845_001539 [Tilletia horrida]KAK0561982.1 hypothetical protein OC861_005546 [Tilletia horrida]